MLYPKLSRFEATFIVLPRRIVYSGLKVSLLVIYGVSEIGIRHLEGIIVSYYGALGIPLRVLDALVIR